MENNEAWVQACASEDLPEGAAWPVKVGDTEVCLYRVEGRVFATIDRCSHGSAQLSIGDLHGYEIECPFHQGRFDVRTGVPTRLPCTAAVQTFPVHERDGVIWLLPSSSVASLSKTAEE